MLHVLVLFGSLALLGAITGTLITSTATFLMAIFAVIMVFGTMLTLALDRAEASGEPREDVGL